MLVYSYRAKSLNKRDKIPSPMRFNAVDKLLYWLKILIGFDIIALLNFS